MILTHDVFAETNPGFCAYGLVAFCQSYLSLNLQGPELPLIYLSLPIALSGDLAQTFNGTNRKTGLLEWFERHPQIQINLADRLNNSMPVVTDAMRYALFSRVLILDDNIRFTTGSNRLKKSPLKLVDTETVQGIKYCERLGYWFAMAGSTRTVFDILGISL